VLPVRRGGGMGLDGGCGCAGSSAMSIWDAVKSGDLAEVERLVGQDPGLLDAKDAEGWWTPLMYASEGGHVGVARWLVDKGAAMDERDRSQRTALWLASCHGHPAVVRLLLESGADPTIATEFAGLP
jgi:ankyrin repeat protein